MATHPHFDDKNSLTWYTDFATALAEAKRTGKRLFIESGRRA